MDNDDIPVGRVWARRDVLALFGAAGAAALVTACGGGDGDPTPSATAGTPATGTTPAGAGTAAATSTTPATATVVPNCVVTPELTEGPYFVDEMLDRSDIRSDPGTGDMSEGVELVLAFNVYEVDGSSCAPISGAMVDVWHCDALGVSSDVQGAQGQKFLRGFQRTDAAGHAEFTTVYPGWYTGRAVHIHFKVRGTNAAGQDYEFTSQLFFNEDTTDVVHAEQPYVSQGKRDVLNDADGIFRQSGGQTLIEVSESGGKYAGAFDLGVQL